MNDNVNLFGTSKRDSIVKIPKVVKGDHLASNVSSIDCDLQEEVRKVENKID